MDRDKDIVLIVDDEASNLKAIQRVFWEQDDINFVFETNPLKALEFVKQQRVAVVMTDNRMPELYGTELLARVKLFSPTTVRIIMTAYADLKTALEAINTVEVHRFISKPWDNDEMVRAVRTALERYRIQESLKTANEGSILSIAQAIEIKDLYTKGHCDRVAKFALLIVDELGVDADFRKEIKYGGWLHDCGKIGVPEEILNYPGRLNQEQMAVIKQHPIWGVKVVQSMGPSEILRNIVLHHHEKMDGTGYPAGLVGKDIPLEARIVAIADVYDALSSTRAYRKALAPEKVMEIIKSMRGNHLDAALLDIFLKKVGQIAPEDLAAYE